jgi:hypothetical protein
MSDSYNRIRYSMYGRKVMPATAALLLASIIALGVGCAGRSNGERTWTLKNGTTVKFYTKPLPENPHYRETLKVLEVKQPGKALVAHEFGTSHAGYISVELRANYDHSVIWLVDTKGPNRPGTGRSWMGCCLEMSSGTFYGEPGSKKEAEFYPTGVGVDMGTVVNPD